MKSDKRDMSARLDITMPKWLGKTIRYIGKPFAPKYQWVLYPRRTGKPCMHSSLAGAKWVKMYWYKKVKECQHNLAVKKRLFGLLTTWVNKWELEKPGRPLIVVTETGTKYDIPPDWNLMAEDFPGRENPVFSPVSFLNELNQEA